MQALDDARLLTLVRDKLGVPEPLINQLRRLASTSGRLDASLSCPSQ